MTRRAKSLLWVVFVLTDIGIGVFLWSRSESWPWRDPKPWIYDDVPVFRVDANPRSR